MDSLPASVERSSFASRCWAWVSGAEGEAEPEWNLERFLPLILVLILCVAYGMRYFLPVERFGNNSAFIQDDLFYYYQCAYNFWLHGFWTFDGMTSTNGVQPLWGVVCTIFSLPFVILRQKIAYPYFMVSVNVVLVLIAALITYSIFTRIFRPVAAFSTVLAGFALSAPYLITGTESGCMILSIALYIRYLFTADKIETRTFAVLSFVVLMSRLDLGVFLLLSYGALFVSGRRAETIKAGLVLCAFALPYFALNYFAQGHILPISGVVKAWWGSAMSESPLATVYRDPALEKLFPFDGFFTLLPPLLLFSLGMMIERLRVLLTQAAAVLVASLFELYWNWEHWGIGVWRWYVCAGVVVWWMLWFSAPLQFAARWRWVCFVLGLSIGGWSLHSTYQQRVQIMENPVLLGKRVHDVIDYIEKNTPESAVIGSWAAGSYGYFLDRRVVHLEGLAGDGAQLEEMKNDTIGYLEQCDYVVQWFPEQSVELMCSPLQGQNKAKFLQYVGWSRYRLRYQPLSKLCGRLEPVHKFVEDRKYPVEPIYLLKIRKKS